MNAVSLPQGYGTRAWCLVLLYHNSSTGLAKEQLIRGMPHGYGSALAQTLRTLMDRGLIARGCDDTTYELTPQGKATVLAESLDMLTHNSRSVPSPA